MKNRSNLALFMLYWFPTYWGLLKYVLNFFNVITPPCFEALQAIFQHHPSAISFPVSFAVCLDQASQAIKYRGKKLTGSFTCFLLPQSPLLL